MSPTKPLAKAAAQRLRGVVVEYDVLCCSAVQAPQRSTPSSAKSEPELPRTGLAGWFSRWFGGAEPAAVKDDRVQSVLQGLPPHVLDKVQHGGRPSKKKAEEEASGSAREKYLDKLSKVKAKAETREPKPLRDAFGAPRLSEEDLEPEEEVETWAFREGGRELLNYAAVRGLLQGIIPPFATEQEEDFKRFCAEMQAELDAIMTKEQRLLLPSASPILDISRELGVNPTEILVVGGHDDTIRAASAAGCHMYHCGKSPLQSVIHSTEYHHLTDLHGFQRVVESLNGVSFRN